MGTNYYLHYAICKCCGRSETLHIGKSSAGWCFSLHIYPERGINTLHDWKELFFSKDFEIRDEYKRIISPEEMVSIIVDRYYNEPPDQQWLSDNTAIRGPNNLARHKKGRYCIAHGIGIPVDYFVGDFDFL